MNLLAMDVMTNDTDKHPTESDDNADQKQTNNAAGDLNNAAQEAMRLFREAQQNAQRSAGTGDTGALRDPTTGMHATSDADMSVDAHGNTTNDLQQDAFKAMQQAAEVKRAEQAARRTAAPDETEAHFADTMRLRLESSEGEPIVLAVTHELVVGRADDVTDYLPDIDLTPHGAYRLGLSRRHAIILRDADQQQLFVKDLNSRNGTFVNGVIVPGGMTQVLRTGDEVRFGNLVMQLSFDS